LQLNSVKSITEDWKREDWYKLS